MKQRRRAVTLVVGILLLAFALRMVRAAERPLWYDEAIAVMHASLTPAELLHGTITPTVEGSAANVHPPLYFLLLHGWIELTGRSPLAVRFLSVGLGTVTVTLLWRLADRCFDRRTGWVVGLLAAVNPFHVAYSQETRMYGLLGLTTLAAAWGLLRALDGQTGGAGSSPRSPPARGRWGWWGLYALSAALTVYTQNLGAFTLLGLNVLAVARRRWRPRLGELAIANLTAVVLYSPWLVGVLPGQLRSVGQGYWLEVPGGGELARAPMLPVFTFYEPAPLWLLGLELFTGLLLLALVILEVRRTRSRAGWFLLLAWVPIVALLLASLWKPLYLERALLPSALLYLVPIGWLLAGRQAPRSLRVVLASLLTVSTAASLASHYAYVGFPRPPFQQAVAYLQGHVRPGDAVVHTDKLTYLPMHYYDPSLRGAFLADAPGSPQDTLAGPTQEALGIFATPTITAAAGTAEQVWLVYFSREVGEFEASGAEHPALAWIEDHYVEAERVEFVDLVVGLYRREEPPQE